MKNFLKTLRRNVKDLQRDLVTSRPGPDAGAATRVASRWSGLASDDVRAHLERISWTGIPQVHLEPQLPDNRKPRDVLGRLDARALRSPVATQETRCPLGCGAGHLDRSSSSTGSRSGRSPASTSVRRRSIAHVSSRGGSWRSHPPYDTRRRTLNRSSCAERSFDFIYFFQSLHHIEALEWVLDQCNRALRPDGMLLINEFVGPSRFQWTSRQLDLANEMLALLPEDLRRDLGNGGLKSEIVRPTVEHMVRHDPSEAVRSADIERLVKAAVRRRGRVELGWHAESSCVSRHRRKFRSWTCLPSLYHRSSHSA